MGGEARGVRWTGGGGGRGVVFIVVGDKVSGLALEVDVEPLEKVTRPPKLSFIDPKLSPDPEDQ